MEPTIITIVKLFFGAGGVGLIIWILSKLIGKKKAEVELALDWQKFYNVHIEVIKKIHKEEIESIIKLHEKQIIDIKKAFREEIAVLVLKMETLAISKETWENDSMRKSQIIKEKDNLLSKLVQELEVCENKKK